MDPGWFWFPLDRADRTHLLVSGFRRRVDLLWGDGVEQEASGAARRQRVPLRDVGQFLQQRRRLTEQRTSPHLDQNQKVRTRSEPEGQNQKVRTGAEPGCRWEGGAAHLRKVLEGVPLIRLRRFCFQQIKALVCDEQNLQNPTRPDPPFLSRVLAVSFLASFMKRLSSSAASSASRSSPFWTFCCV